MEPFQYREDYNSVHFDKQAEKKSNLVGESAKLEVSCLDSRQKNHEENRAEQEDKQANHFGLDLELPHPDHYLPETGQCEHLKT